MDQRIALVATSALFGVHSKQNNNQPASGLGGRVISRRHLIGSSMVAALGAGVRVASAFEVRTPRSTRLTHLIVDARFDEALEFAQRAAAPGARIIALPRDVLALWRDELLPILQSTSRAIGGVTTEYGFFALATLAADQRLRAQLTARHEALVSWVVGPAASRT